MSEDADSLLLTAYAIRASFLALDALMRETFAERGGRIESGELAVAESLPRFTLSAALFSRWTS